jgi:hypothetical protein
MISPSCCGEAFSLLNPARWPRQNHPVSCRAALQGRVDPWDGSPAQARYLFCRWSTHATLQAACGLQSGPAPPATGPASCCGRMRRSPPMRRGPTHGAQGCRGALIAVAEPPAKSDVRAKSTMQLPATSSGLRVRNLPAEHPLRNSVLLSEIAPTFGA